MGDRKITIRHPRLRAAEGEIPSQSYEALKKPGAFSQELLNKILLGISTRKYRETLFASAAAVNYDIEEISISAIYLLFSDP
jgi:putative transposase